MKNYEQILDNKSFNINLHLLNGRLIKALASKGYSPTLIGNLFYDHCAYLQPTNLPHIGLGYEMKRRRFTRALQNKKYIFEIGINGGHSSFLALESNDEIIIYANDIAQFYKPFKMCHPEIYVPEACKTLKDLYGDRFNYVLGDCLEQVPLFIKNNPDIKFDFIHIDGAKNTYMTDFKNLYPSMCDNCTIVFDDYNEKYVKHVVQNLIDSNYIKQHKDFDVMGEDKKYSNYIATKI